MKFFVWIVSIFKSKKKKKAELALKDNIEATEIQKIKEIDPRLEALKSSSDKINKLNIIHNFFKNDSLDKINEKSKEVHDLFRINEQLNIKKLEQFHYYYTDNLIEMLSKLKKSKEDSYGIINEKLKNINSKLKSIINNVILDPDWINKNKNKYNDFIIFLLSNLYHNLSKEKQETKQETLVNISKYTKKDMSFDEVYSTELFYEISDEEWISLEPTTSIQFYEHDVWRIEKKLMGKCHKNGFRIEFIAGLKLTACAYLLNIKDTEDYFIYMPQNYSFYMTQFSKINKMMIEGNTKSGRDKKLRVELEGERNKISSLITEIKSLKDEKIIETLKNYLIKISNEDFLGDMVKIDLDRKYLDDILNTEKLAI